MKQRNLKKSESAVFRRWNNKGYAIFNSLKKMVKIGCLLVVYLRFANPEALAETIDSTSVIKNYDLESIDVTSDQLPETYSSLSRVVVTISQKEIERAAVFSLNELLEYASNIDIRQRGINGAQADISVRGSTFDQVLILINGINITDPQTGHNNLSLPLDLSVVDKIEILKGPGSWKFGPGAFGGAINIITKNPEKLFIKAGVEGGEFSYNSENISAGFRTGCFTHLLSVNHSSSAGYTDNTDYKISNFYYKGNLSVSESETSLQIGYTDKSFGANSFYSAKYPDQFESEQILFSSLSVKTTLKKVLLEPKVYFKRKNDRFFLFRDNPGLYSNYHTTDVWGTNFLASYFEGKTGVTMIGFDSRTETIWSNNLGEESQNPVYSPVNDTILLNYFHSRTHFSSFVSQKIYLSDFIINVGVNFTRNTDLNFKWFIYPGLDISYTLSDQSTLSASVNKTMRMPTYTDLYYKGPANEGNPFLLPEEAVGYELDYRLKNDYLDFSLAGFYTQGTNLIDWVKQDLNDKWKTMNYTTLNTLGAEVTCNVFLNKILSNQKILKKLAIDYTWLHQDKKDAEQISNYTLNYLKHSVNVSLDHAIWKNIQAEWHFTCQDRNGQYEKYVDKVSQGLVSYEPFAVCDLKISYTDKGWNFSATVNNLFNTSYYDIGNIVQPGRWIRAGISKKIDFN